MQHIPVPRAAGCEEISAQAAAAERDLLAEIIEEGPARRGELPGQPNHRTAIRRAELEAERANRRRGTKEGGAP